ncbi:Cu2_monoox_C domain-containing protein [Pseudoscourfieldia marina]
MRRDKVKAKLCEGQDWPECGNSEVAKAKAGEEPNFYLTGPGGTCNSCNQYEEGTHNAVFSLTKNPEQDIAALAAHEYLHHYQGAAATLRAEFTNEGGAVLFQCMMSKQLSNGQSFRDCLKFGGGSSGVIPNALSLYSEMPNTKWMKDYGLERCCGSEGCPCQAHTRARAERAQPRLRRGGR